MKKILLLTLVLCFSIYSSQSLEQITDSIIKNNEIPEMAFAVITKDSILLQKVIGHHKITEVKENPNAKPTDFFHLGSNTKAITGFISAYLVEGGKIKWNTKFFDLFPDLKKKSNAKYHDITLEELLSHRAFIQPFTSGNEYSDLPEFKGNRQQKRTAFAKYILTLPPLENQNVYNYSNAGYSVATMMLEQVSGKSWEELATDILKSKLKLDFYFGWPNRNAENQPFGHWLENGVLVPVSPETNYDLSFAEPAGDLSMNIQNYSQFIQLNIRGLSGEDNILKSETYKYLHTSKKDYSIGWANYQKNNSEISEHAGSDGTFFSYTQIDRKQGIGYIVVANSGTEKAQKAVFEIIDLMKNKYGK